MKKPQAQTTTKQLPTEATKLGKFNIHENKNYVVVIGKPPVTPEMPYPQDAYLIVNKETGVTESWHGILFYAKQAADHINDLLVNPSKREEKDKDGKQSYSFN